MAQDSGGLAAFVSSGDDFTRQAKAFRRKLMHPAVSSLALQFNGIDVYDLTPAKIPNLYFGSPVRVYGRYKGSADAQITLTGQVMGQNIEKTLSLPFPKKDETSPEIERMWAQKHIDQLLKLADRNNDRKSVIDEVVQLGETFSIVTEYTSFLVLENDEEYKRWKIERRNLQRIGRDRSAQNLRQQTLASIRQKSLQDLGPQAADKIVTNPKKTTPQPTAPIVQAPSTTAQPVSKPTEVRKQSRDINFGSGPVGPLFVGLALLMRRRKKK
jgi:Ca-activated chloride channel family protein